MMTIVLALAAAALLFGGDLQAKAAAALTYVKQHGSARQALAGLLLAVAVASYFRQPAADGEPVPVPEPARLDLRGLWKGPTASEDAAVVGALCGELADELEFDGTQAEPFLRTGVAVDELRQRARELRCRGVSVGARQPAARDAIHAYLDSAVGTAGGPISPEQRARWVNALRDIAEAATDAA